MQFKKEVHDGQIKREFIADSVHLTLPSIIPKDGDIDSLLQEIAMAENQYFHLTDKMTIKCLASKSSNSNSLVSHSLYSQAKAKSHEPTNDTLPTESKSSVANGHTDESLDSYDGSTSDKRIGQVAASKVTLNKVKDYVDGNFHSFGTRWIEKQKKTSVIYLTVDGELSFIVGSNFQDHKLEDAHLREDNIRVIKVSNYKKAADRSNAKAARFEILNTRTLGIKS